MSLDEQPEEFWLTFVHITPHPEQQWLMDQFCRLCPYAKPTFDGYTVEIGEMSDAAWEFLREHAISNHTATVPRDVD